jgi:maltose alpha-D-glucosyltransferase / alpha-amylase
MAAPGFRKELFANLKAELPAQLPVYLKKQRWFGGKAREIRATEVVDVVTLHREGLNALVLFVNVEYQGGGADLYSIPLIAAEHDSGGKDDSLVLGVSESNHDTRLVFVDALKDEHFLSLMLDAIERDLIFRGAESELRTSHTHALSLQETGAAGSLRPRAIKAEQSNSSIAYGDRLMLKFIRRLEEGVNPDLEMSAFLTGRANYPHTPQLLGAIEYRGGHARPMTQGILQAFVPNQGDAWQYTMKSISSFYESMVKIGTDQHGFSAAQTEFAPASMAAFLESVGLLAKRTAELHLALASDSTDPAFAPEPFDIKFQASFEGSLLDLTARVFAQLRQAKDRLSGSAKQKAEAILSSEQQITPRFRSALENPIRALRIRIHGDYHLGQVLYTGSDFVIIDFEGEPARALSERRLKRSPLQDVAGMLRSFHYAAYAPLFASTGTVKIDESNRQNLNRWAEAWAKWVGNRYLEEYFRIAGGAAFLPPTGAEIMALLELFVLEKAVYELGYELNNRPDWVSIPLEGISKVLEWSIS